MAVSAGSVQRKSRHLAKCLSVEQGLDQKDGDKIASMA